MIYPQAAYWSLSLIHRVGYRYRIGPLLSKKQADRMSEHELWTFATTVMRNKILAVVSAN